MGRLEQRRDGWGWPWPLHFRGPASDCASPRGPCGMEPQSPRGDLLVNTSALGFLLFTVSLPRSHAELPGIIFQIRSLYGIPASGLLLGEGRLEGTPPRAEEWRPAGKRRPARLPAGGCWWCFIQTPPWTEPPVVLG